MGKCSSFGRLTISHTVHNLAGVAKPFVWFTYISLVHISFFCSARRIGLSFGPLCVWSSICAIARAAKVVSRCKAIDNISEICATQSLSSRTRCLSFSGILLMTSNKICDQSRKYTRTHWPILVKVLQAVDKMGLDQSYFEPFRIFYILDRESSKSIAFNGNWLCCTAHNISESPVILLSFSLTLFFSLAALSLTPGKRMLWIEYNQGL